MALVLVFARSYREIPCHLTRSLRCCLCVASSLASYSSVMSIGAGTIRPESFDPGGNYRGESELEEQSGRRDSKICIAGPYYPQWVHAIPLCSNFKNKVSRHVFWFRIQVRQIQSGPGRLQRSLPRWALRAEDELWSLSKAGDLEGALDALLCVDQHGNLSSLEAYKSVLMACSTRKPHATSNRVHDLFYKYGFELTRDLGEHVVILLVNCRCFEDGLLCFYKLPYRTVYSWTAVISGYTSLGLYQESLRIYKCMLEEGLEPDSYTMVALLKACRSLSDVEWIQAEAEKYRNKQKRLCGCTKNC